MAAQVGNITAKLGGVERRFALLSVEELAAIGMTIPNATGEIIDLRALDRWSKNTTGCEQFLYVSAVQLDASVKIEQVRGWGSIMARVNLANDIFTRSITTGEEDPDPKGEASPPTGTSSP